MLLLRYEKESLKDYMVYNVSDDQINSIISCDNGFSQCFHNSEYINIRLYFKVIFYNKSLPITLENFLTFINEKFKCETNNWTIMLNQRMLHKDHCISIYFFSNKYYTKLSQIKSYVDNLYYSGIMFDISVYYQYNSKYRELVTLVLPNQSHHYFKYNPIYKIISGNPSDLVVTNIENLTLLDVG